MISAIVLLILLLFDFLPAIILSYEPALLVMLLCLPITVTSEISRSALEYQSRFKTITMDEFTANLIQYSIVLLWTFYFEDWKGLLYGWLCYQFVLTGLTWVRSGLQVSFRYHKKEWTDLYHHGYALSSQNLVQQAKRLVNPIIIGYFAGTQGVGVVSFAQKIVQGLSFYREALYRVSASMIGKLKPNDPEIGRLMEKGIFLQMLPLGLLLLMAGIGVYSIKVFTNDPLWGWVNALFPFLATGYFYYTIFTIPILFLQMNDFHATVFSFLLVKVSFFAVCSFMLIQTIGIIGYGIAELISIPLYFIIYRKVKNRGISVLSNKTQILIICIPIALFWYYIDCLALFALPAVFLLPEMLKRYRRIWKEVRAG